MRKSLNACVLLLVLCCPAFAGDMLTPPAAPPPPATTSVTTSPDGEISDPAPANDTATQDISVTEIAVSLFESLLTII